MALVVSQRKAHCVDAASPADSGVDEESDRFVQDVPPSVLSSRQKRVVLVISALVVGLVVLVDKGEVHLRRESAASQPDGHLENTEAASHDVVQENLVNKSDGKFNDWELHLWEEELAEKEKRKKQHKATARLTAAVSEAEQRTVFVRRRKCIAADLVKYKLSYEQRDGLTKCEQSYSFGPTCFAHICTTRAYLPGDVYLRAERNLDDTLGVWLRSRMATVQKQMRATSTDDLEVAALEVNQPVRYKLSYKHSVIPNFLSLAHALGSGVIASSPLGLVDPSNRWSQAHDKYLVPLASSCTAAAEGSSDGALNESGGATGLLGRRLLKKGGRKKNTSPLSQVNHQHLDAWGCLFANAAELGSELPRKALSRRKDHRSDVGARESPDALANDGQDGGSINEEGMAMNTASMPPKHTTVPETQPAPAWLGTGIAWREFLRLSSTSAALRDVWLPAQVAHFLWQPSTAVLSAAEAVSVLSNYSGPRYLGRDWHPGSANDMVAQGVDPVDRLQYAWPLKPVVGVVAMGRDFGKECYKREYEAACKQWLSKVGGKTTMQEALQRYQQRLWREGKNPAVVGADSLISECFAGGSKGESRRKAASRIAQRKCPIEKLTTAIHELKVKYGAKILHLVTDAPDIPQKLLAAKRTKRKESALGGMQVRKFMLSGSPGARPFEDMVGVHLLRASDMLVGLAEHLELPLLLLIGRTGVVPPFVSMDRPPLLQARNGARTVAGKCTTKSCAVCDEEARQRMQSPPVPLEWARHESGHDLSAGYKKMQQLGALNEDAQSYEVYVSSDHGLPADVPELPKEGTLVALEDLRPPGQAMLHATKVTATHLQATWTEPPSFGSPIQRYEAKLSIAPGPDCPAADYDAERCVVVDTSLTAPLFEVEHVAEGRTYLLRVRAENEAGWGNFSAPLRMTTPALLPTSRPSLPTLVELFQYSDSCSATLRWDLPSEDHGMPATEYEIETRVYGGPIHSVTKSEKTMATVEHLPKGIRYLVRVRARNSVGWSEYGEALSFWSGSA